MCSRLGMLRFLRRILYIFVSWNSKMHLLLITCLFEIFFKSRKNICFYADFLFKSHSRPPKMFIFFGKKLSPHQIHAMVWFHISLRICQETSINLSCRVNIPFLYSPNGSYSKRGSSVVFISTPKIGDDFSNLTSISNSNGLKPPSSIGLFFGDIPQGYALFFSNKKFPSKKYTLKD